MGSGDQDRVFERRIPALMHAIDEDGRLIEVTDHWLAALGYQRDEVIGKKSVEFLTVESRRYAESIALPRLWTVGYAHDVSCQFKKKNGEILDVLLSAITVQDQMGASSRSIAVLTEVTERKRAGTERIGLRAQLEPVWKPKSTGVAAGRVVPDLDKGISLIKARTKFILEISALFCAGGASSGFQRASRSLSAPDQFQFSAASSQIARKPVPLLEEERPAARLEKEGANALTSTELLSILLSGVGAGRHLHWDDAECLEMARHLLHETGGLAGMASVSIQEIRQRTNLGLEGAAALQTAFVLGLRSLGERRGVGTKFHNGKDFFARYGPMFIGKRREIFISAFLDTKNRLIRDEIISEGTLNECIVHPREVFSTAIRESANTVALIHNHPSGDPEPSCQDRELTVRLVDVGRLVGIQVIDHIIIGTGSFFSFAEKGLLQLTRVEAQGIPASPSSFR